MRWVWSEQVRDTRLPGAWSRRLDTPGGWRLRRRVSPFQPLVWLATGTSPSRIGYAPGPLRLAQTRRAQTRTVRLCLLEGPGEGPRFSPATAYWINRRSTLVHAVVDSEPERADLVWVHAQDPLTPASRGYLERSLAGVPKQVPVLNPLDSYDAYHRGDTFARLADAGVSVPDPSPRLGARVVLKGPGQASEKRIATYAAAPPAGWRAFAYVDARGPDGLHRRFRAFHWLGVVHPGDVVAGAGWEVGLGSLVSHTPGFELTPEEVRQVRLIGRVLGLDWFCVDFVRRAADGAPVFTDVNVYPTPVVAEFVDAALGHRGRWHFLDTAQRMGAADPHGSFWPRFDAAVRTLLDLGHPLDRKDS